MLRTTFLAGACALALTAPLAPFAPATPAVAQDADKRGDTPVVETIGNNASSFAVATLLIKRAGLEEALNAEGPFTLFVPADNAFAKLPDEVMLALLDEKNKEKLATLLRNHVVQGKLEAGAFIDKSQQLETLAGNQITVEGNGELLLRQPAAPEIKRENGRVVTDYTVLEAGVPLVSITDAGGGATPGTGNDDGVDASVVLLPDITASNGVIHAISDVLVPEGFTDGL